jgi:hypothetical protein
MLLPCQAAPNVLQWPELSMLGKSSSMHLHLLHSIRARHLKSHVHNVFVIDTHSSHASSAIHPVHSSRLMAK